MILVNAIVLCEGRGTGVAKCVSIGIVIFLHLIMMVLHSGEIILHRTWYQVREHVLFELDTGREGIGERAMMLVQIMAGTRRKWFPAPFLHRSGIVAAVVAFYRRASVFESYQTASLNGIPWQRVLWRCRRMV